MTDWSNVAWAIAVAVIAVAIMWAGSNTDTTNARKYEACVKYHSPQECK